MCSIKTKSKPTKSKDGSQETGETTQRGGNISPVRGDPTTTEYHTQRAAIRVTRVTQGADTLKLSSLSSLDHLLTLRSCGLESHLCPAWFHSPCTLTFYSLHACSLYQLRTLLTQITALASSELEGSMLAQSQER